MEKNRQTGIWPFQYKDVILPAEGFLVLRKDVCEIIFSL